MKTILLFFAGFCLSISTATQEPEILQELNIYCNALTANWISEQFMHRFQKGFRIQSEESNEVNPKFPLIPKYDDPFYYNSLIIPLDLNVPGLVRLDGDLSFCYPEHTGLSKLTDDLLITLFPDGVVSITWTVYIPTESIKSPYQIELGIDSPLLGGLHNLTGEGQFSTKVNNVFFKLGINFTLGAPHFSFDELFIDLGFENLTASAQDLALDGFELDLNFLAELVHIAFGFVWNENTRPVITEQIRCSLDHFIGNCSVADIIGINFGCLNSTRDPDCFDATVFEILEEQKFLKSSPKDITYCDAFEKPTTETTVTEKSDSTRLIFNFFFVVSAIVVTFYSVF